MPRRLERTRRQLGPGEASASEPSLLWGGAAASSSAASSSALDAPWRVSDARHGPIAPVFPGAAAEGRPGFVGGGLASGSHRSLLATAAATSVAPMVVAVLVACLLVVIVGMCATGSKKPKPKPAQPAAAPPTAPAATPFTVVSTTAEAAPVAAALQSEPAACPVEADKGVSSGPAPAATGATPSQPDGNVPSLTGLRPANDANVASTSRQSPPLTSLELEMSAFASPKKAAQVKPWHATHMFSTMKVGNMDPATVAQLTKAIVTHDKRIHDLSEEALEWKFGSDFTARCSINIRRCAGVGSTATVYCGTRDGKKAAFKVMNITKTAPYIMSMLQRSVLTELAVHEMLNATAAHEGRKHLLTIMDCVMFPPFDVMRAHVEFDGISVGDGNKDGSAIVSVDGRVFEFAQHSLDNGLEVKNQFDMCTQVIMVYPLCEIGQLLRLCRGTLKIPSTAIPLECMTAVISTLGDQEYLQLMKHHGRLPSNGPHGLVRDMRSAASVSQVLMEVWDSGEKAYLRAGQLPPLWFNMLKLQMLLQVTEAVKYLHDRGVIHCDIKLDNVFLTRDDRMSPFKLSAKLGDLGMCRSLDANDAVTAVVESREDMMTSRFTTFVKGTPGYCAPEMFNNGHMSRATDIYSLGVLCSIALSPDAAFVKRSENDVQLVPRFPEDMHPQLRATLDAALGAKPKLRPSLTQLKDAIAEEMARISEILATTFDSDLVAARDRPGQPHGQGMTEGMQELDRTASTGNLGNMSNMSGSGSDPASSSYRAHASINTLHALSNDNLSDSHVREVIDRAFQKLDPSSGDGSVGEGGGRAHRVVTFEAPGGAFQAVEEVSESDIEVSRVSDADAPRVSVNSLTGGAPVLAAQT